MSEVTATLKEIKKKSERSVKFGPLTSIDVLKSGKSIRLGMTQGDEIQGWQRVEAIPNMLATLWKY